MTAIDVRAEVTARDPGTWLTGLLDPGAAVDSGLAGFDQDNRDDSDDDEGDDGAVRVAKGALCGVPVVAYAVDGRRMVGAAGERGCARIAEAIELGVRQFQPVIGVWRSGPAARTGSAEELDGMGRVFVAMVRASGKIPQLSVLVGPVGGCAGYAVAFTDVVITAPDRPLDADLGSALFEATGAAQVDVTGRGVGRSGVVHVAADDEPEAFRLAGRTLELLARPGRFVLESVGPDNAPRGLPLADGSDVRPLVRDVLDGGSFLEFQADWAPNVVVGLGRLAARTVGLVANNPRHRDGCLDSPAAEKAARFVRMCDAFGLPLLVLADVPAGHEPGRFARCGAKLRYALADAVVPRVTLVTRGSRAGVRLVLDSPSPGGNTVLAWPGPDVAASPEPGGDPGVAPETIDPAWTRRRLVEALAPMPAARGSHRSIPL